MIISLAVKGNLLKKADELVSDYGFKSRSEVFRAGLKELLRAREEKLSGPTKCVLMLSHKKEKEAGIVSVRHVYEDLLETQIHAHLADKLCTEIFILSGDGERINQMIREFRRKGAERLVLVPGK